jgi:hypothetical protein
VLEVERDIYHLVKLFQRTMTLHTTVEDWKRESEDYRDDINLHKVGVAAMVWGRFKSI